MLPINPQVKVVIDREGNVRLEVVGVQGPAYIKLTRDLETALAGGDESRIERAFKPEFGMEPLADELEAEGQEGFNANWQVEGF